MFSSFLRFYVQLRSFLRFYAVPILALIATHSIPKYMRAKIVNGVERMIDFIAYAVFLVRFYAKRALLRSVFERHCAIPLWI